MCSGQPEVNLGSPNTHDSFSLCSPTPPPSHKHTRSPTVHRAAADRAADHEIPADDRVRSRPCREQSRGFVHENQTHENLQTQLMYYDRHIDLPNPLVENVFSCQQQTMYGRSALVFDGPRRWLRFDLSGRCIGLVCYEQLVIHSVLTPTTKLTIVFLHDTSQLLTIPLHHRFLEWTQKDHQLDTVQ